MKITGQRKSPRKKRREAWRSPHRCFDLPFKPLPKHHRIYSIQLQIQARIQALASMWCLLRPQLTSKLRKCSYIRKFPKIDFTIVARAIRYSCVGFSCGGSRNLITHRQIFEKALAKTNSTAYYIGKRKKG